MQQRRASGGGGRAVSAAYEAFVWVDCNECGGRGSFPLVGHEGVACTVCGGRGEIAVPASLLEGRE